MVTYREYKNGDEKDILTLYNNIYKSSRDEEYWKWQYKGYPFGEAIIELAEENDIIVGQTTILPTEINYKGNILLGGYSIDSIVDKEYRRKGIYVDLANRNYESAKAKNVQFRYGFPIYGALLGLTEKLGASIVDDIPVFLRIYRLDNFLVSKLKNKTLARIISIPSMAFTKLIYREKKIKPKEKYIIREVNDFNENFDMLWDKVKNSSPLMTPRKANFLKWRINNHPTYIYNTFAAYVDDELQGYMIIKLEDRKMKNNSTLRYGNIIDMIGINDNVIGCLYFHVKGYFKEKNVDFVLSWASESMLYRKLLVNLGFNKSKTNIPFLVKDLSGDRNIEELVTMEKNWYIMPIEADIY